MDPRNAKKLSKGKTRGVVRRQTQPTNQVFRPEMSSPPPQQYFSQGYRPQFDTSQYYSNTPQSYPPQFDPYEARYDNVPQKRRERDDEYNPFPLCNDDDDEDVELVQETQPNAEAGEEEQEEEEVEVVPAIVPKKNWTSEEEEALAKAWIKISVDKDIADRQKRVGFWTRVTKHFKTLISESRRTHDQLCSKWKNMNAAMMVFNGLYTQLLRLQKSGCNEIIVFEKALEDYCKQQHKSFNHVKAWKIVKDHPKWSIQPLAGEESAGSNKKRKSSDSSGWDNQNPPTPIDDVIPNLNDDPCPTRKNKGKKKMGEEASSQTGKAIVLKEYAEKKLSFMELSLTKETVKQEKYNALLDEQRSYIEKQRLYVEQQTSIAASEKEKNDIEFLTKPHDNLSESVKQIVILKKRAICEEHGWPCDF